MKQELMTAVHRIATEPTLREAFAHDPEEVMASLAPGTAPGVARRILAYLRSYPITDEALGDWYGYVPPAEALFEGT